MGCEEFKLPGELVPGTGDFAGQQVCAVHGRPVETVSETNWFFRLSAFRDALLEHYEGHPNAVAPQSAYNEVVAFIRSGLQDLSISRSTFDWGIPVPWDESQVVYVWFDALLNYATAVGLGDKDPQAGAAKFAATWPADIHLVGKDILRFHAVIWPAMLMAAGCRCPPGLRPRLAAGRRGEDEQDQAHRHLARPDRRPLRRRRLPLLLPARHPVRPGRLVLLGGHDRAVHRGTRQRSGQPGSRATAMVDQVLRRRAARRGSPANADLALADDLLTAVQDADAGYSQLDFTAGIGAVKRFVDAVNLYVTEQQPWALAKRTDDPAARERLATVLYTTCEALRAIAVLHNAVMPRAMGLLWEAIGAAEGLGPIGDQRIEKVSTWGQLPAGVRVTKGAALFPRLPEEAVVGG